MLKAKQLSNLSNNARLFFLGGPWCNPSDSGSCSSSENVQSSGTKTGTNGIVVQKPCAHRPALSEDAAKMLVAPQHDAGAHAPVWAGNDTHQASNSMGPTSVMGAFTREDTCVSSPVSEKVVRAGMAAAEVVSDVMNFKLPMGSTTGITPHVNHMVDPSFVVKSYHLKKPLQTENLPKANAGSCSKSCAANQKTTKAGGNRSSRCKELKCTPSTMGTQSVPHPPSNVQVTAMRSDEIGRHKDSSRGATVSVIGTHATGKSLGMENVKDIAQILSRLSWGPDTKDLIRKIGCPPDAYHANRILKQIGDHAVATEFFYWLKGQPGFKHDNHTYTTMIGILGRAQQFVAVHRLLGEMVREGCHPTVVTYNRIIHSYGRANYLKHAVGFFHQMQRAGCQPDRVTYCTLIDLHAKAGYIDFAMELYHKMQSVGLSPDTFTYSVIINCLGKAGHLPAARELFSEMVQNGCAPNLVTYNIMIALHAKARDYGSALWLYRDMQRAGFKPDKVSHSIVMEVLGQCGHLDEAEAVLCEMHRNGVPDEPAYGLLVDLWGKAGNADKAWQWYTVMLGVGLRPNVPICNSLLSAFLRAHRLDDACNLLQSMLGLGLCPTLKTYTLLLSCCTEALSAHRMGFLCDLMAITGHPAHFFLLSMPSAGPDGQNVRDHTGKFLDLIHCEERESKRGLVDAVVDFLHKTGLKEEAASVWEVAAQKYLYPEAITKKAPLYWLINLHVMSDGTAVIALSRTLAWFRRNMLASGRSPARIDIVTGWGRRSRVAGSSLVRQRVQELLHIFSFPFFVERGNSGCFIGHGDPLSQWLLQSCVERMHLL